MLRHVAGSFAWSATASWCGCGPIRGGLTEFYLFVAAGGALGGVLVSLVAPLCLQDVPGMADRLVLSYLLAAAVLLRPETLGRARCARLTGRRRRSPIGPGLPSSAGRYT